VKIEIESCVVFTLQIVLLLERLFEKIQIRLVIWVGVFSPFNLCQCKKLKAFYTGYRALGPELIPVYRQSAHK